MLQLKSKILEIVGSKILFEAMSMTKFYAIISAVESTAVCIQILNTVISRYKICLVSGNCHHSQRCIFTGHIRYLCRNFGAGLYSESGILKPPDQIH